MTMKLSGRSHTILLFLAFALGVFLATGVGVGLFNYLHGGTVSEPVSQVGKGDFEVGVVVKVRPITTNLEIEVNSTGYYPDSSVLIGLSSPEAAELPTLYELSNGGDILAAWEVTNKRGGILGDRRVLPDGRIMFTIFKDGVYIIDRDGQVDWYYIDDTVSHHAELLPNGNVLTVGSYCDCVKEIAYESKAVVWRWDAVTAFPNYDGDAFTGGQKFGLKSAYSTYAVGSAAFPNDWTHINHAQWLPETDTFIVSLRNFDLVAEIDRAGKILWSFGPGIIKQQHTPRVLDDGTLLVFDNGNHRAIRVKRDTQEIIWEYNDLYAPIMGDVSLLSDGNYKVVDSIRGMVKVVAPSGQLLWSITIYRDGQLRSLYRAHLPALEN